MKKNNSKIKGLSLLEALVSTAIIGIGFIAILQMTNYSVQSINTSGERTKANFLTNMIAEDVLANKNPSSGIADFSDFFAGDSGDTETNLSAVCSGGQTASVNSGNIYGNTVSSDEAKGEFGISDNKDIAPNMKLKKWQAILNSKDYLNCIGNAETRDFTIFRVTSSWAGGNYSTDNILDEAMYIGRVKIILNNGNKAKYLYFQSDYKLKGGPTSGPGEGEDMLRPDETG